MDEIDKKIILWLDRNCRTSYEELARNVNMSANAVRKRVLNLIESGIIEKFVVMLHLSMIDTHYAFAFIHTNGDEDKESLYKNLRNNPEIVQVFNIAHGYGGLYIGVIGFKRQEELSMVGDSIRTLEYVTSVDIDIILYSRGNKAKLTKTHIKILKSLVKNPRMSISDLAETTGFSARKIGNALKYLHDSGGVNFSILWNLSTGGLTEVFIKIQWNAKKTNSNEIINTLRTRYPLEFWSSFVSSLSTVMYARFVVNQIDDMDKILSELKIIDTIDRVSSYVCYSSTLFILPGEREMLRLVDS